MAEPEKQQHTEPVGDNVEEDVYAGQKRWHDEQEVSIIHRDKEIVENGPDNEPEQENSDDVYSGTNRKCNEAKRS
ncbi:hypothetical protein HDU85_004245 [Gaertneriomyces sp. JEL0708]|nr:hypothetical protein HDU85_004245 [Gaertneriomyces sp. JEL0708]